jgi:hypothetical protein
MTATLDNDGMGSIFLPYTDQPGFADGQGNLVTDWTYRAVFNLSGAEPPLPSNFQLPLGPASVDLDLTTPQTSSTGQIVAYPGVISVNGQTGVVTVDGGGGGGGGSGTLAGIVDMSTFARELNVLTTAAGMRAKIGAGTASTQADVGLGNVNDTSDANKPISTLQAAAFAKTIAVVVQVGATYPTPPTGHGAVHYYGTTDPVSLGITLNRGDEWISLA